MPFTGIFLGKEVIRRHNRNESDSMRYSVKQIAWPVGITVIIIIAVVCALMLRPEAKPKVEVSAGHIHNIETYVRLCSVDIYSEVPVLDTINNKVIFGIQKQSGSITFDIERLRADTVGDTVRVILPKEIVELYESTAPDSWQVVDTKNISVLGFMKSSRLTAEEENMVKNRIKDHTLRRLYKDGTIARARREGAENLKFLLEKVFRKPIEVTDSTDK